MVNEENAKNRITITCIKCGKDTDVFIDTSRFKAQLCRDCFGKRKDKRANMLNDLTGKEWASKSKSVEEYIGVRTDKQRTHGACYPLSLAKQQISIYTKKGQVVFDPFVGVGTTTEAAEELGRKSIGIELSNDFIKLAKRDIKNNKNHKLIHDDARNMLAHLKPNSVDFQMTSPPYGNLLKTVKGEFAFKWKEHSTLNSVKNPSPYSEDKRDLGNLT